MVEQKRGLLAIGEILRKNAERVPNEEDIEELKMIRALDNKAKISKRLREKLIKRKKEEATKSMETIKETVKKSQALRPKAGV